MDEILDKLRNEDQRLQFVYFNEDTAWDIGCWLVEHAIQNELPITIDIRRGGYQLFHASRPGTSADPLALYFPNSLDGLLGVRFVHSVIQSGQANGEWIAC